MYLEQVNNPEDLKKIPKEHWNELADEIRQFLIESISVTGGHLASNLGTVELTMALHLAYDFSEDKVVWDVGHQCYTHKILTGRKEGFDMLRKEGGLSGFPKTKESPYDSFNTGHSSTSISAALGFVEAREILKEKNSVVAVIGDGSLTGGLALEAINNASKLDSNMVIVLNDNNMSISENVGGVSKLLNKLRTADAYVGLKNNVANTLSKIPVYGDKMVDHIRKTKANIRNAVLPKNDFGGLGITYFGPIDGHNIEEMRRVFKVAKDVPNAAIVHVLTKKGKGYDPAERHPSRFHGTVPYEIETGIPSNRKRVADYTDVFSTVILKMGERDEKIVAVTAAMPDGTGLKRFRNKYPERFFDVGIAEEHAVTFSAGLAMKGLKPVVAIYSSFLQRAYDQLIHDVCMQNLPVVFTLDRAGLVGSDGETHHGIFDLSYLSMMPNMIVMAPKNKWELSDMLKFALVQNQPVAIRYPRGTAYEGLKDNREPIVLGKSEVIKTGGQVAVLAIGAMVKNAEEAINLVEQEHGVTPTFVNVRFAKPIDTECIRELAKTHNTIITVEENVRCGGFGEQVAAFVMEENLSVKVKILAIPDRFIEQGTVDSLHKQCGIDKDTITEKILESFKEQ